jgi:hypothetical protein
MGSMQYSSFVLKPRTQILLIETRDQCLKAACALGTTQTSVYRAKHSTKAYKQSTRIINMPTQIDFFPWDDSDSGTASCSSSTTTSSSSSSNNNKTVRFSEDRLTFPNRQSPIDMETTWYKPRDYMFFRLYTRRTIKKLRKGATVPVSDVEHEKTEEARGLEDFIHASHDPRAKRSTHIQAILNQQAEQRKTGVHDPEALRNLSRMCSNLSRQRAIELAKAGSPRRHQRPVIPKIA